MPGAGAGQEIAKRLNGLKRMFCPPPRGFGQGLSTHPSLPCTERHPAQQPADPLLPSSVLLGLGGAGRRGPRVPGSPARRDGARRRGFLPSRAVSQAHLQWPRSEELGGGV